MSEAGEASDDLIWRQPAGLQGVVLEQVIERRAEAGRRLEAPRAKQRVAASLHGSVTALDVGVLMLLTCPQSLYHFLS